MEKTGDYITIKNMIMSYQVLFHLTLQYDNKTFDAFNAQGSVTNQ